MQIFLLFLNYFFIGESLNLKSEKFILLLVVKIFFRNFLRFFFSFLSFLFLISIKDVSNNFIEKV